MNKYDLSKAMLLIVDVQNDFCPGGSLAVSGGDEIVPLINALAPLFPVVAATRDWHPKGHVSFASSHKGKAVYDMVNSDGIDQVLWPDHCIRESEGAELHPGLDRSAVSIILHKGTQAGLDSYSAFYDNDHRSSTGLDGYIKGLGLNKIYVCGLALDYCVHFSAMDAVKFGFETYVIRDATRGVDVPEGNVDRTISTMTKSGINLINSSELLNS